MDPEPVSGETGRESEHISVERKMKIESPVFGQVEVAEDKVIEFPLGLPGFEDCRRFILAHEEGVGTGVFILQSLDDPAVAFSVTGPEQLGIKYEFALTNEEIVLLGLLNAQDAQVAVIVRKGDDAAAPASAGLQANFMAPLVINAQNRKGLQKVINKLGCEIVLRAQT